MTGLLVFLILPVTVAFAIFLGILVLQLGFSGSAYIRAKATGVGPSITMNGLPS
jgi:hypothetical protein